MELIVESKRSWWRIAAVAALMLVLGLLLAAVIPERATSQPAPAFQFDLPELPDSLPPHPTIIADPADPNVAAQAAILMDGSSAVVLYRKDGETKLPIASLTKLMTALVVREKLDLDLIVEIAKEHTSVIGSDIGLLPGEKIGVRSLLVGLLVASGNDAAWALAEAAGGSREAFVAAMNEMAAAIGLKATQFVDPAGLDPGNQSTVFELSALVRAALADPVIAETVRLPETTITSTDGRLRHDLKNSNRLVNDFAYLGAIGVKTGFTPEAGHNLAAGAERDGHRLIAIILHTDADTITASAIEARKLLDWGWQNVRWE